MDTPLSYSLNKDNVKKFIDAIQNPKIKEAIRILLNNTTHVSHKEFVDMIKINIESIINLRNKKRIYVYEDTKIADFYYKSNFWIFKMIKEFIKAYDIKLHFTNDLNNNRIKDGDMIMLIDDCIYSGIQLSNNIERIKNNKAKKLEMLLFVPYISKNGLNLIKTRFAQNKELNSCTLKLPDNYKIIVPFSCYATEEQAKSLADHYVHLNHKIILEAYPIYFDHKVAKHMSSFPTIYSGIVPNIHNQGIIVDLVNAHEELDKYEFLKFAQIKGGDDVGYTLQKLNDIIKNIKEYINNQTKELQIIPLLNNCQNVLAADLYESSCPIPPYKTAKNKALESIFQQNRQSQLLRTQSLELLKKSKKSIGTKYRTL
jgi:hypothetical protein